MKLTNKLGLPQAIFDAVSNDDYDRGDSEFSISGLLAPARVSALTEKHWEELEEDVSDRIFALFGKVGHGVLERSKSIRPGDLVEHRFFMTIDVDGVPCKISGKTDNLAIDSGLLDDYKFTTVWKVGDGNSCPMEYEQQINCYITLLEANGHAINKARIIAMLKDWSVSRARRDPMFPQQQVCVLPVTIWAKEDRLAFIRERIRQHRAARIELPECTSAEKWERGAKYAVMKRGNKKAIKLFDSEPDAFAFVTAAKDRSYLYIEKREAEQIRCLDYCSVAHLCDQWAKHPTNPANKLQEITGSLVGDGAQSQ